MPTPTRIDILNDVVAIRASTPANPITHTQFADILERFVFFTDDMTRMLDWKLFEVPATQFPQPGEIVRKKRLVVQVKNGTDYEDVHIFEQA